MLLKQINRRVFKFKIYLDNRYTDPYGNPTYNVWIYSLDKGIRRYAHTSTITGLMADREQNEYVNAIGSILENAVCFEALRCDIIEKYLQEPSRERIRSAREAIRRERLNNYLDEVETILISEKKYSVPIELSPDEVKSLIISKQEAIANLLEDIKSLTELL